MARAISLFVILMIFWFMLSGQTDAYLLGCGVFSCSLVTFVAIRKKILDREGLPLHLVLGMLLYFPWLFWQILLSNLDVAYRVWHPRRPINPRLLSIPFETKTDLGTVIYCNSITLTPGTVTVSVDNESRELLIHALSDKAAEGVLSGEMHEKVKKLEGAR